MITEQTAQLILDELRTHTKLLESIKTFTGLSNNTLDGILQFTMPQGEHVHKPSTTILSSPEELGFDGETPREWLEKLRLIPRVISKLNLSLQPGCWIFSGQLIQGSMYIYHPITGRKVTLRKYLYEYLIGPLPDGFRTRQPDCHPLCVNPNHLGINRKAALQQSFEADDNLLSYVRGMEKQRQNRAFEQGQKYLQFPMSHWDIVYRTEKGEKITDKRFGSYKEMHNMYHYLDPIINTPLRDPDVPTDLEWMNKEMGPVDPNRQPAARVQSLAESLGIEE